MLTSLRCRLVACTLALATAALGTSCGSSSSGTSTSASDCSAAGENEQLLSVFRDWYYWFTSIPADFNPSAYATASDLVDGIRSHQPLDRFSFIITKQASDAFFGAGQYTGYGFSYRFDSTKNLELTQVYPASPAEGAGLARGDRIVEVNGTAVPTLVAQNKLDQELSASGPGVVLKIGFVDLSGASHAASMTSAQITQPSVSNVTVVEAANGRRVGYFLFDSFIDTSNGLLDSAVTHFVEAGVEDLVIDERYNGGGELSVAQHLATLVAGTEFSSRTLGTLTYNDKHTDQNQSVPFSSVSQALSLKRVFFITSGDSASASEFIINGLRPYVEVVTVGAKTFGKPVGENGFNVCSDVLYPITFKIVNSQGAGDYFDGIPVTCTASDDVGHALGDAREASLATTLHYVASGNCGAQAAAAARESAIRDALRPRPARYGWRQLINSY
jgi:C-terminal processing protease CtpA/Prc